MNATPAATAYALGLGRSKALIACATLADASRAYRLACEDSIARTGRGASVMPEGRVYDLSGTAPRWVARVSWNGRVWAGTKYRPDEACLYPVDTVTAS